MLEVPLSCVNRNPFDWMGLGTFKSWVSLKLSREIIRVRIITRPRHPVSGTIINTEATPRTRPWHIRVTSIPSPTITDNTIDKVETKGLLKLYNSKICKVKYEISSKYLTQQKQDFLLENIFSGGTNMGFLVLMKIWDVITKHRKENRARKRPVMWKAIICPIDTLEIA